MKRLIALVLALLLAAGMAAAAAEGRDAPADRKEYRTDDIIGRETLYRTYDKSFYEQPSGQPGTIVPLPYASGQYGEPAIHWANVYLPYGYEEDGTERYPILYFFHGTNETQDSFITEERVKNAVDNMIEAGVAPAFIMVCPTYYYDYANRALNVASFVREIREELMPTVESRYRTFAETADADGFTASRRQRAFAGYSRGGRMTWEMFGTMLDYAYWYLPMSGAFSTPEDNPDAADQMDRIGQALAGQPDWTGSWFVYVACGGKRDAAYDMVTELVNGLIALGEPFSYGTNPAENNLAYCLSNELHQTLIGRFYLYNAFRDGLFR